jgi:hypothetical protein
VRLLRRRNPVLEALRRALPPADRILAGVRTLDGRMLAASRFGLWFVAEGAAECWDWHLISKARLADGTMHVTVVDVVETWPDGTVVVRDRPEVTIRPQYSTRLTDIVHQRVRRSVAASRRLDWPGAGAWVALRRVAGHDGLAVQVRLDPGADAAAAGFAAAVAAVTGELWPAEVPGGPADPVGPDGPDGPRWLADS